MVSDIQEGDGEFGLLWHDPDEHGPFMNERGRVGTVARLRKVQSLPDGRSIILIRGMDRFAIQDEVEGDAPYYEALIRTYEDDTSTDPAKLVDTRVRALALFHSLLQALPHAPEALPDFNPEEEIAFKLAAAVNMDPFWQQELLEMTDERARLHHLTPVLQAGLVKHWEEGGSEA
jgi:Lon protease-like protein